MSDLLDEFLNSADQCFIKNFCSYVHQGDFSIIFIFCCVCQVDNINNHTDLVLPPPSFPQIPESSLRVGEGAVSFGLQFQRDYRHCSWAVGRQAVTAGRHVPHRYDHVNVSQEFIENRVEKMLSLSGRSFTQRWPPFIEHKALARQMGRSGGFLLMEGPCQSRGKETHAHWMFPSDFHLSKIYIFILCIYLRENRSCVWRWEDSFCKSALTFHHVASRDQTQVIRLGNKCQ